MKLISNFRNATVFDIESDGLLDEATIFHVLSFKMVGMDIKSLVGTKEDKIRAFFQYHLDKKIPVVAHNGIGFDKPLAEKLLNMDLSELMVIDTLALSWYLNTDRQVHGLGSFHDDYGIEKPPIDDWEGLTYEEYKFRCETDVDINVCLWEDLLERLTDMYTRVKDMVDNYQIGGKRIHLKEEVYVDRYMNTSSVDDYIQRILTFLCFKMDCAALQEATKWEVGVDAMGELQKELTGHLDESREHLEVIMDKVPAYAAKNKPKKPYKMDGTLSASGLSWEDAIANLGKVDDLGNSLTKVVPDKPDTYKILRKYNPPNVNSSVQIKNLLFKHGWRPETFEYKRDDAAMQAWVDSGFQKGRKPKPRKIPQVSIQGDDGKELCPSVRRLVEEQPEIEYYDKYTTVKHRSDMIKGWEKALDGGKHLKARIGGFTNTLRVKHRELVNLPSVDKPYGEQIRGLLIAGKGKIELGTDLSSLEDRVKHHFMMAFDPEYVATMMEEDFDPHLEQAVAGRMITKEEMQDYKAGNKTDSVTAARKMGKQTNYSAVYGCGADTLARSSGMTVDQAKALLEGYHQLNWSVQAIADDQTTFTCREGKKWLINPINGFCYSLRTEKDRFSTLCQGTGSFFFDMWVDNILEGMYNAFGVKRLTASFHDEVVLVFKDTQENRDIMEKIVLDSIEKVNVEYMLRRNLGCDVQFGDSYDKIH